MLRVVCIWLTAFSALLASSQPANARTKHGAEIGTEVRAFAKTGMQGQEQVHSSARFQYEFFTNDIAKPRNQSFEMRIHARVDEQDDQRTHVDVREFSHIYIARR